MPLEPPQDLVRQQRVEVVRDPERPGAEAKGSGTGLCRRDRSQLRDWATVADHENMLSGLNPVQQGVRVEPELAQADGGHTDILADRR